MEEVQHKLERIESRLGSATRATYTPAAEAPQRAAAPAAVVTPKTSVERLWQEYHAIPNAKARHEFWKQHRELHV